MSILKKKARERGPQAISKVEPENPVMSHIRDLWDEVNRQKNRNKEIIARTNLVEMDLRKKIDALDDKLTAYAKANYGLAEVVNNLTRAMQRARVTFELPKP